MDELLGEPNTVGEAAELKEGIQRILEEIATLREQMRRDRIEIEQSRARTRAMLADLSARRKAA